ncbi:MAG TPA: protein kinase [Kofleriaceae bacterium]|nr:protein kinase [Kofleriaceae bacterium]
MTISAPTPPSVPLRLPLAPPVVRDDEQTVVSRHSSPYISRARSYAFVVDAAGHPIELGSGRFGKAFLGEERWVQSRTSFRRPVAIKILQRGVSDDDRARFQLEKEILERVQGHPNIVEVIASGEADNPGFVPPPLRARVDNDFVILELMDMSLEERLKGWRHAGKPEGDLRGREDLLALAPRDRLLRVLEYMLPVATAVEYAHRVRDTAHRDIKPANVLLKLPDAGLAGSQLQVKLADFNVAAVSEPLGEGSAPRSAPGTIFFQSPEQEVAQLELLVDVTRGSIEVDYFEDFYVDVCASDAFSVFNRPEVYSIVAADRARKKLILSRPFAEPTEQNVRGLVVKQVGRPADIYSLGAMFYYLASGAYANPKTLHDAFKRFIEYDRRDDNNNVASYIQHEYSRVQSARTPRPEDGQTGVEVAPGDRFFSYKQFLDGAGELIDPTVMLVVARAMIRNKPDSYCMSWDARTDGITHFVRDLIGLYTRHGYAPSARSIRVPDESPPPRGRRAQGTGGIRRLFRS